MNDDLPNTEPDTDIQAAMAFERWIAWSMGQKK